MLPVAVFPVVVFPVVVFPVVMFLVVVCLVVVRGPGRQGRTGRHRPRRAACGGIEAEQRRSVFQCLPCRGERGAFGVRGRLVLEAEDVGPGRIQADQQVVGLKDHVEAGEPVLVHAGAGGLGNGGGECQGKRGGSEQGSVNGHAGAPESEKDCMKCYVISFRPSTGIPARGTGPDDNPCTHEKGRSMDRPFIRPQAAWTCSTPTGRRSPPAGSARRRRRRSRPRPPGCTLRRGRWSGSGRNPRRRRSASRCHHRSRWSCRC